MPAISTGEVVALRLERLRALLRSDDVSRGLRSQFAALLHEPLCEIVHALSLADAALGGPDPEVGVAYAVDALDLLARQLVELDSNLTQ